MSSTHTTAAVRTNRRVLLLVTAILVLLTGLLVPAIHATRSGADNIDPPADFQYRYVWDRNPIAPTTTLKANQHALIGLTVTDVNGNPQRGVGVYIALDHSGSGCCSSATVNGTGIYADWVPALPFN